MPRTPEYRSERREAKHLNARKMGVSGRSVFLLQELSARPKKKRRPWLDRHEKMRGEQPEEAT